MERSTSELFLKLRERLGEDGAKALADYVEGVKDTIISRFPTREEIFQMFEGVRMRMEALEMRMESLEDKVDAKISALEEKINSTNLMLVFLIILTILGMTVFNPNFVSIVRMLLGR